MASSTDTSYTAREDLTTCSICFETFKTPKYFPCLHSFCEECIKTYISTAFEKTKSGVNCPMCRMFVSKPGDVSLEEWSTKLPTNHILVSLIDKNESCERYHRKNKFLSSHKLVNIESSETPELPLHHTDIPCTEHPDKRMEAYCSDHSGTNVNMLSVVPTLSSKVGIQSPVTGIAISDNGQVVLSNHSRQNIKLRDPQCSSVLSSLSLPAHPYGIKMTSDTEGAVAVYRHGLILFNIQNNQITKVKEIKTKVNYDFVYHQDKYYVGCNKKIAVYDSDLGNDHQISVNYNVGCMAVRDDSSLCYTEWGGRELHCITMYGTPVFTYSHDNLQYTTGVTVDHGSFIYVCGYKSRNVHQLTHDGKLQRIIFDNLPAAPYCVIFNKRRDNVVVGCDNNILLYDLK